MRLNEKIGQHTFEIRSTGMGSIDPWFMEILDRYNISAIGTSDCRDYLRYDGKIYEIRRHDRELDERISLWETMFEENKEEVERDILTWIEKYCDTKFGGYTLEDIFKQWDIEIVNQLEWIRRNDDIIHAGEKTFGNMCQIFGEMVNKRCYMPEDEFDVEGSEKYISMEIPVNTEISNVRLEVFENGFQYTRTNADGSVFYSGLKELNKNNISEFINTIKKPRKNGNA